MSLLLVLILLVSVVFVVAQDDNFNTDGVDDESDSGLDGELATLSISDKEDLEELKRDFEGRRLVDAGYRPGDVLYFLDRFSEFFSGDDLSLLEERAAEMIVALNEGDKENARVALSRFKEKLTELKDVIEPERKEDVRGIIAAIDSALDDVGLDDQDEFDYILEGGLELLSTTELRGSILALCDELNNRGEFGAFSDNGVCGSSLENSKWGRERHQEYTEEQKNDADNFVRGIGACMRDPSSSNCNCDVANDEFKLLCEQIVEAEKQCRTGNEDACGVADDVGDKVYESLKDAPHLLDALKRLDRGFEDSHEERFDDHIPQVCREAHEKGEIDLFGPNGREECFPLVARERLPERCLVALDEGRLSLDDGESGLRRGCEEIMRDQEFDEDRKGSNRGPNDFAPALGLRCNEDFKNDPEGRLKCFDEAFATAKNYYDERYEDRRIEHDGNKERYRNFEDECPVKEREDCLREDGRWDCRKGYVECFEGDFEDFDKGEFENYNKRERDFKDIGRDRYLIDCPGLGKGECQDKKACWRDSVDNKCFFDSKDGAGFTCNNNGVCDRDETDRSCPGDCGKKDLGCVPDRECPSDKPYGKCEGRKYVCYGDDYNKENDPGRYDDEGREYCDSGYDRCDGSCVPFGKCNPDYDGKLNNEDFRKYPEGSDSGSGGSEGSDSGDSGGDSGTTGSVIRGITGNAVRNKFLEYYFGK